ncbi:hypothetical protein L0U85_01480 [Glycomyces sp. L485]|uniref:hypothetical protein n=1 Tax=Glycomyces sp. L485 TaxID=2909235 RepID=UPI001F4B01EF|nr:hypothetical protein [Glycomyces sp. L485]MCH7229539.1 hypothetical protein [Glycomyces sp. L485]
MRHQSTAGRVTARTRRRGRKLLAAAAAAVLPIVAVVTASPAQAQAEPHDDPASAAAAWLADQSSGDYFEFNGAPDVSTTLDALIGLMAARVGGDQVQASLEWLNEPDTLNSYVYPGGDAEGASIAVGAAGKVMYVVATAGGDPTDFGGVKLADEVAAAPLEGIDGSTLSWAALGLSRTEDGVPPEIADALTAAQCDDGGFSFTVPEDGSCTSDTDTTGIAVAALTATGDAAADTREDALQWLRDHQDEDGSFSFDEASGPSANSTAMAAQALLTSNDTEAAQLSVTYLIGLQISCGEDGAGAVRFTDPEDPEFGEISRLSATAQSLVPLAGQNYAELDATDSSPDVPTLECPTAGDDAATADEDETDTTTWVPWVIVAAVIVLAGIIAYLVVRARRGGGGKDGE